MSKPLHDLMDAAQHSNSSLLREFVSRPENADAIQRRFDRLVRLSHWLDAAVTIPGTSHRVGLDSVIGLIPGFGDACSAAFACYIVFEAKQLGVPTHQLWRMAGNIVVDTLVGTVPVVGDLFDVAHKANLKNVDILEKQLTKTNPTLRRAEKVQSA